ncbi:MAG: hypothetical protein KC616_24350 [Myxococcales bacterium]|nr:hypothetical protein [Myxococcales bacterium]
MGRVHWVGGEKGGVGKSVVARLLAQYWIDRAIPWTGFDTDRSHGALLRYYSDYATPIEVDRVEDLDRIIEALDERNEEVVVDLAAQTEAGLDAWFDSGEVLELLDQLGHESWYWYVIDDGKDSVRLLARLLDRLPRSSHVVCVLNRGRGRDFSLFEESKLRQRIEQRGGDVIELPALHPESMLKMDAYDKSFWAAIHNTDPSEGPCLTRMQRQRAKVFIRKTQALLRGLFTAAAADERTEDPIASRIFARSFAAEPDETVEDA